MSHLPSSITSSLSIGTVGTQILVERISEGMPLHSLHPPGLYKDTHTGFRTPHALMRTMGINQW